MKSEKLIFVGYADGRKAYRFLNPMTGRITISRDAKFLELCNFKEAVKQVHTESGDNFHVPLVLPPTTEENNDLFSSSPPISNENSESEPYDSASEGEDYSSDSHDDEDVRRSQRPTKGIPPVRLIEEAYIIENALEEEREQRSFHEAI